MDKSWLKARQTKYAAYFTVYTLVVLGALGAINFLAQRYNKSYDSTANKRYSLSEQTEKVVKGLKRDVTITYYDQTRSFTGAGGARDLLERYNNLSPKLHVAYVDPDRKPQLAKAAGIQRLGTTIVDSGSKKEEAKSLTEEDITSALIRSLKEGQRLACFVSGSGEHALDDSGRTGYSGVKEEVEKNNYQTRTISLLEKAAVPNDCSILVVAGPRFEYPEPIVKAIQNYVEGGGHALLMIDPPLKFGKDENSGSPGLVKMLAGWGVKVNNDLALDTSGIGQIFGLSEVVPLVTTYESHPIVSPMTKVATAFPLARTLETTSADKVTLTKLFSTSSNSFATTNLGSAEISINPDKDKKGPLTLGVAGEYRGAKEGRFVVTGSSGWAANNILRFNGNRDLLMNMMNWLSSDEDLISIRPKPPEDRPLNMNRRQMVSLFWGSVIGFPLIVIGGGLSMWWRRR